MNLNNLDDINFKIMLTCLITVFADARFINFTLRKKPQAKINKSVVTIKGK